MHICRHKIQIFQISLFYRPCCSSIREIFFILCALLCIIYFTFWCDEKREEARKLHFQIPGSQRFIPAYQQRLQRPDAGIRMSTLWELHVQTGQEVDGSTHCDKHRYLVSFILRTWALPLSFRIYERIRPNWSLRKMGSKFLWLWRPFLEDRKIKP